MGDQSETRVNRSPSLWLSKRFCVAIVIFFGFINAMMVQSNINIAIVEMTSAKSIVLGNLTIEQPAEFQWDPSQVGIISSIHSYGGLFSLVGAVFVNILGGSVSSAFVTLMCAIMTLLQPVVLYLDFRLFIAFRFFVGLFANCFMVSSAEVFSKWFPKSERSTLISFCYSGMNVGATVMFSLFGYIADRFGWRMVFYVSGIISMVISLLGLIIVKNRPSQDNWISKDELVYILDETDDIPSKHVTHNYKKILSSAAVWALCFGSFAVLWVENILSGCLPLYAKDLTGKSTDEIGFVSSIPTAVTIFTFPIAGIVIDYCKNHCDIKPTRLDKRILGSVFVSISVLLAACTIFSNFTVSIVIFMTIEIAKSLISPVLEPNVVNVAPNDSSIVCGLSKVIGCISTVFSRTLTGFMTINHTNQEWNNCFLLASAVSIGGAAIYMKYGSSEAQPWSLSPHTEDESDCLIKKSSTENDH